MPPNLGRLSITAVALVITTTAYWFTFQPSRPFGPVPILVVASSLIVAIGGMALGEELSYNINRTDHITTMGLQFVGLFVLASMGVSAGYLADPGWWDSSLIRIYLSITIAPGILIVIARHIGGVVRARIQTENGS